MNAGVPRVPRLATAADLPAPGGRVHLMGVGGAGMRGLAVLLRDAGYRVSGCDREAAGLDDLTACGISVEPAHDPSHVDGADLLIRSSAVPGDAPEVAAAERSGVPVLRRARALGALVNDRVLVGIAGTHGKTTITGMTGHAAEASGLDPLVLIGGHMPKWGGFARPGAGPAVVEADEYDRSFLELSPTLAVVSSVEAEHLDTYGDLDGVRSAFREFAERAIDAEGLVYCQDDEGARDLAAAVGSGLGYGFSPDSWCRIEALGARACRLTWPEGSIELALEVPGRHNQQNAAAAFVSVLALGGDPERAARGLEAFAGVGRRLETLGAWSGVTVVDDYAHHPTEVAASLGALRDAHPGARLAVVFQPHLYTRTRDFAAAFAAALESADEAWVLPVYPAREAPIEGVTAELIVHAGGPHVQSIDRDGARRLAADSRPDGSLVLAFMGAGDVTALAHEAAEGRAAGAVGA